MRRTGTGLLDGGDDIQIVCFAAPDYCHIVIMHTLLPLFFFLAQPFWETKAPEAWSIAEIEAIRTASPWAQRTDEAPVAVVYLATAAPIEHAEAELRLRLKKNPNPMLEPDPDYVEFLSTHRADTFVLAVTYPTLAGLGDARESKRMEEESVMLIGKKSYGILGHFPPTPSDPVLRLIFPRAVKPDGQDGGVPPVSGRAEISGTRGRIPREGPYLPGQAGDVVIPSSESLCRSCRSSWLRSLFRTRCSGSGG